jgi:hypothetical protein
MKGGGLEAFGVRWREAWNIKGDGGGVGWCNYRDDLCPTKSTNRS